MNPVNLPSFPDGHLTASRLFMTAVVTNDTFWRHEFIEEF